MEHRLGFVTVIEAGELEAQVMLLVESIRRIPTYRSCPIYVVQPRSGTRPSRQTLESLAEHDAVYLFADRNQLWRHFAFMNKVYAAAFVEARVQETLDTLVWLDADMLVIQAHPAWSLSGDAVAAVHPHDTVRMAQHVDAPITPYWRMIYEACGVSETPAWHVTTTVEQERILPYFNGGLVAVKSAQGIFQQEEVNAVRLSQHPQLGKYAQTSFEYYFLEQALLAGTLVSQLARAEISLLDTRHNYPLNAHCRNPAFPKDRRATRLNDLIAVHYHQEFYEQVWRTDIAVDEPLASWLVPRLPLPRRHPYLRRAATWVRRIGFARHVSITS